MDTLKDLREIYESANGRFSQYEGRDFVLPEAFKSKVREINSYHINYNQYSAVIKTRENSDDGLSIYLPNQWFYVASYFTEFYNELIRYKSYAVKAISRERLKDLNGSNLTDTEVGRIDSLNLDNDSKERLKKFITNYSWWHGAKTIDRGDFYVSPILNGARLVNASQSYVADLCAFLADKQELVDAIISGEEGAELAKGTSSSQKYELQKIFYGAPGTGKSHKVKELTGKDNIIRTTFHPDSDYSTFVGAYKPTTVDEQLMTVIGTKAVPVENSDGSPRTESKIVYEFVEQAFLKAYIKAWKLYAEDENNPKKQYLVIEEINRGNCAQIFGDLFQLLDRGENGFSEYPIDADQDMQKHLAKAFKNMAYLEAPAIGEMSAEETARAIRNGEKLILPSNLYIWATMNTSDQSLFPIDSAFKRRWDWEYVPIHNCKKDWRIVADNNEYDWWSFLNKINDVIGELTSSEDKKLGYFFCQADDNGIISSEKFVSKVIFYLWNEVFKDFDVDNEILNDADSKLTFNSFYGVSGEKVITRKDKVELFLTNLGVDIVKEIENSDEEVDEKDSADGTNGGRDKSRYSINGEGSYKKSELVRKTAQMYVDNNSGMSADEVIAVWRNIGVDTPHFVETQAEYDARVSASKDGNSRANPVRWGDNVMYVTTQWGIGNIGIFVDCINRQNWNITINKIS